MPQDREGVSYYKEDESGQVLQEGINELGAISSWVAAATSYSTHDLPMVPFYIFYSMFGFQRVGDMTWLAGDQQARGFLLGATAGRTTLNGEGLQHEDGHNRLASTVPNCVLHDPTFAYEVVVIIQMTRAVRPGSGKHHYYITLMNETHYQPPCRGCGGGIRRGIYKLLSNDGDKGKVKLLGSGISSTRL